MPKDDKTFQVRIESILGGHSPVTHFAAPDQFQSSLGIDPALGYSALDPEFSGLLVPASSQAATGTTINKAPMWLINNPKDDYVYVFDTQGSTYTYQQSVIAGLSDGGNESGTGSGNGAAYYDNYIYFAKNTTIARYGPLNGTPTLDGDYWGATLGKAALTHTTYPYIYAYSSIKMPNHVMHRHSDGRLYVADVVDNQGTIHYIATSKTTVEGDTNNGSTFNKVQVGYGLWPTAIESYGSNLVIAFYEGGNPVYNVRQSHAKLAFWDTTSQNINQIIWVEFPDAIITAMKNVNGVLYITSTNGNGMLGLRITRLVGGYTVEEVAYLEYGIAPFAGGLEGTSERLLFGTIASRLGSGDNGYAGVYSLGLQKSKITKGLFNVFRLAGAGLPTALLLNGASHFSQYGPIAGYTENNANNKIMLSSGQGTYNQNPSVWWSQIYKVGQPFKITKIRIPLAQAVAANMIVTPKIYTDDEAGTTYTLTAINNTNDPGQLNILRRSGSAGEVITGQHNFWLELRWTGSARCVVNLPIIIEYELLDD